ncbi:hypothetical protein [Methylopila sp. M107]|uniref:hypothetical protein n=1 Tax=Methylopila sp. M107 TaxID=1101190 RepID=UPI0012DF45D6|nr:hypothetical protein [Methylopila sp. M107]
MADEALLDPAQHPASNELAFDYVKAPDFRVVWADGAIGSLTPQGMVHFALYAERPAIPRRQVFSIGTQNGHAGALGPEIQEKRISRRAIVREMACDVFLTAQTAENLAAWLLEQAQQLRKLDEGR